MGYVPLWKQPEQSHGIGGCNIPRGILAQHDSSSSSHHENTVQIIYGNTSKLHACRAVWDWRICWEEMVKRPIEFMIKLQWEDILDQPVIQARFS